MNLSHLPRGIQGLLDGFFSEHKNFVLFRLPDQPLEMFSLAPSRPFKFGDAKGWVVYPFEYPRISNLFYPFECQYEVDDLKPKHPETAPRLLRTGVRSSLNEAGYRKGVSQMISSIEAGYVEKVVFSRRVAFEKSEPFDASDYLYLWWYFTQKHPSAFVYLFADFQREEVWLGVSPELFLSVRQGSLETHSIAGTLFSDASGKTASWTEKEYVEQEYVSRHILSELSRLSLQSIVCQPLEEIRFGSLTHLVSRIEASGIHRKNVARVVDRLFPTPAVCGFPKRDAKDFILNRESYSRSLYSGLVGLWKGGSGCDLDFFVNIRVMDFIQNSVRFYVGGGIVASSDPEREWLETERKLATLTCAFKLT